MTPDFIQSAYRYHDAGLSLIPVNHQTKRPLGEWKAYQARRATKAELDAWLTRNVGALAVVCGAVSGGLEILDFDDNADATPEGRPADDFFWLWMERVGRLIAQYGIPYYRTGGGGYQVAYRCETIEGNQKLAWVRDDAQSAGRSIAIETRGEGGYAVVPPSLHPSGRRYGPVMGDLAAIPTIPAEVRAELLRQARILDEAPFTRQELDATRQEKTRRAGGQSVIETFNQVHSITALLARYGYLQRGRKWSRPGKDDSLGVNVDEVGNVSFHWSSNDPMHKTNPTGRPLPVDPFDIYTHFEHNGDVKAAVKAAARELGLDAAPALEVLQPQTDGDAPERDPLDVTAPDPRRLDLGWLQRYAVITAENTGSPYEFNLLNGLVALSAAIGGNARLPIMNNLRPNLYGMIVAPSTIYHKSTSLGAVYDLFRRAVITHRLMSNNFSTEGLLAELADLGKSDDDKTPRPSAGLVIQNEIGFILGAHKVKYLAQLKTLLTDLYDCMPIKRRLNSQSYHIPMPVMSVLGATTPKVFYENAGDTDWQSGFLVRWLFVTPEAAPDFRRPVTVMTPEREAMLEELAELPRELARRSDTLFHLDSAALDLWNQYQAAENERAYMNGDDRSLAIMGRYNAVAMKLSIILAAMRGSWGRIDKGAMVTAIDLTNYFKRSLLRLLDEKDRRAITGGKLQKTLLAIHSMNRDNKTPTQRDLVRSLHEKGDTMREILEELHRRGAVVKTPVGRSEGYYAVYEKLPVGH
jgi:hypothetical protein